MLSDSMKSQMVAETETWEFYSKIMSVTVQFSNFYMAVSSPSRLHSFPRRRDAVLSADCCNY